jgi:hypothetical protein
MATPAPRRPVTAVRPGPPVAPQPAQVRNPPLPGSTTQDVGHVPAVMTDVPVVAETELKSYIGELYDVTKISPEEILQIYELLRYKGFNRVDVLKQLTKFNSKIVTELVVSVALSGPQRAYRTKLSNGQTPAQMGIPASGAQGTKVLTLNRIAAATADLAAYYLKQMNVPKRMDVELPGWLQFPTAGSIKMPDHYRRAHLEFSKNFSQLIGGFHNEQIYFTMEANSYLDEKLKLFQ